MMAKFNPHQLTQQLQQQTPDELEADMAASVDEETRALLEQRRNNPGIEDFLRDSGRYTREQLEQPPEFKLPDDFHWQPDPGRVQQLLRKRPGLRHILLLAAMLTLVFLALQPDNTIILDSKTMNLQRLSNHPGAEKVDRALYDALKQRGYYFLELARKSKLPRHFKEAYSDLSQAAMLMPDNAELNDDIRVLHRIIVKMHGDETR